MVHIGSIRKLADRIVQAFNPEQIILFGSYAYGTPTADSDVDLLVILPFEGKAPRKSLEILNSINPGFAVDILVRTPEQVQQRLAWNDFFLQEIMDKGKVLYETAHV
jgi:predicted nucleotidyltransferase